MNRIIFLIIFTLTPSLASADDEFSVIEFGGDVFATGSNVTHESMGTDDLFMAGEKIQSSADITGSAHAAGRRIKLHGSIGEDVYAAGMDILLTRQVAGDVTVSWYEPLFPLTGKNLRLLFLSFIYYKQSLMPRNLENGRLLKTIGLLR